MVVFVKSAYHKANHNTQCSFFLASSVSGQNEVTNYIISIKQEPIAKYLCQTSSSPKREKPFNNFKQSQA